MRVLVLLFKAPPPHGKELYTQAMILYKVMSLCVVWQCLVFVG